MIRNLSPSIPALIALLQATSTAAAADASAATPVKAPPLYNWTGFYAGAHAGYATGSSDWTAQNTVPGPLISGTTDLFSRAGGLEGGFQAGYNVMLPSRVVLGFETDVTFPNYLNGALSFATPTIGQASTAEAVEFTATARGRLGYAIDRWLIYGTGGL
ncbi:MAG: porin, partial [Bradyrhizobiaceae bacterium]|nr:porin [Bradyrhizobiaceae bacterium]